jgi:hypothetical protein
MITGAQKTSEHGAPKYPFLEFRFGIRATRHAQS